MAGLAVAMGRSQSVGYPGREKGAVHFPRQSRRNRKGKAIPFNVVLIRVVRVRPSHRATAMGTCVLIRLRILRSLLQKMYHSPGMSLEGRRWFSLKQCLQPSCGRRPPSSCYAAQQADV